MEETPGAYINRLVEVFTEVHRILKPAGTLWLNMGDSYNGSGKANGCSLDGCLQGGNRSAQQTKPTRIRELKPKDLIGIPWMLAFALRAGGWYLRQDIIWHKPNPMPESVRDRCTKAHEYIFLLTKSARYYFDRSAMLEPAKYDGRKDTTAKGSPKYAGGTVGGHVQSFAAGRHERWPNRVGDIPCRNRRSVWTVPVRPFRGAHFATYPPALVEPCIMAGCPPGGVVLDPFFGAGTTGVVARKLERNYIGIDLNHDYVKIAGERLAGV
jgi:DNA modification methylase